MVSTHIAWGCYSHICLLRFSQGLSVRRWHIQFHASYAQYSENTQLGLLSNKSCARHEFREEEHGCYLFMESNNQESGWKATCWCKR